MPTEIRFRVRLGGQQRIKYVRGSRHFVWMYVVGVSWNKDRISKFRHTPVANDAFAFSKTMAETVLLNLKRCGYQYVEIVPVTKLACGHTVTVETDGGEGICACIKEMKHA